MIQFGFKHILLAEFTILFLLIVSPASAQKGQNFKNFDRRKFHFGFSIGGNMSGFRYTFNPNVYNNDTIVNIGIKDVPGLSFAGIASWDITEMIHLRANFPSFSFQERDFVYTYLEKGTLKTESYRLESTNLDFPVMLKLRSKRINNFAAYALVGAYYGIDLASQRDVDTDPGERVMKIKKFDYGTQFGGGFDFFMPYYKFAIELKISNGINNLHIPDDSFYASPITSLRTRVWWLSISFEG